MFRVGDYECRECRAVARERRKAEQNPRDNVRWVVVTHSEDCPIRARKLKLGIPEQQWI